MDFTHYIEIDPNKRFGRPVLIGTRIAVGDVLNWLGFGMTRAEIMIDFPELSENQINACLMYAAMKEKRTGLAS